MKLLNLVFFGYGNNGDNLKRLTDNDDNDNENDDESDYDNDDNNTMLTEMPSGGSCSQLWGWLQPSIQYNAM